MNLTFPNPSRSYDATMEGIRFWAYDQTMEVSFFIEVGAIMKIDPASQKDEAGMLETFDVNRDRIHRSASNVYSRRHISSHIFSFTLTSADL